MSEKVICKDCEHSMGGVLMTCRHPSRIKRDYSTGRISGDLTYAHNPNGECGLFEKPHWLLRKVW